MAPWKKNLNNNTNDLDRIVSNVPGIHSFKEPISTGNPNEFPKDKVKEATNKTPSVNELKNIYTLHYYGRQTTRQKYPSRGSLDDNEMKLEKAQEFHKTTHVKAWRIQIQEAILRIQEKNDERQRQKLECLSNEEKEAFDYIEKAKEAIACRDLVTTEKYLRDALDLITVPKEKLSRNMKNHTEEKDRNDNIPKMSNDVKFAMQTVEPKYIKETDQVSKHSNVDEAGKFSTNCERINPDECVNNNILSEENVKQKGVTRERIENLRKISSKQCNPDKSNEFYNLDYAKTFTITSSFGEAQKLLKTLENLYTDENAKEFFRRIQMATENQKPSNYNVCDNETSVNESNKSEAYNRVSKAKRGAHNGGNFENTERQSPNYVLLNRSQFFNSWKKNPLLKYNKK